MNHPHFYEMNNGLKTLINIISFKFKWSILFLDKLMSNQRSHYNLHILGLWASMHLLAIQLTRQSNFINLDLRLRQAKRVLGKAIRFDFVSESISDSVHRIFKSCNTN